MVPAPAHSLSDQFIEASPYCVFQFDLRQQRLMYISPNVERLWGYRPEEILAEPDFWKTIAHPDDLPALVAGILDAIRAKAEQTSLVYRVRHVRLGYRWVENIICLFYDDQGAPLNGLCYALDIHTRKLAEDEQHRSQDSLQRIFNASPASIAVTTLVEGRFLYFNDSALRLAGFRREEIVGQTNASLGFWPNGWSLARLICQLRKGKPVLNYEHVVQVKGGEPLYLLSSFDLIELDGHACVINISIDISDRKRAEKTIRQMNKDLTSLMELGQLLASNAYLDDLLFSVVRSVHSIFTQAEGVTLWLYDEKLDRVVAKAWTGFDNQAMSGLTTSPTRGIIGSIFSQGRPRIVEDYSALPTRSVTGKTELDSVKSLLGVPLQSDGQVFGVMFATSYAAAGAFGQEDVRLLQSLANQVALTIKNHQLFEAESSAHHLADTLRAAYLAISKSLNLRVVLENLLDVLRDLVPYDSADVELLQDQSQLVIWAARGYEAFNPYAKISGSRFNLDDFKLTKYMIETRQSLLAADVNQFPDWVRLQESSHINSWLGVPIIVQGEVIGLYSVDKAQPGFFTTEHLKLAEMLALPAALAIGNARLFEEVSANREQLQLLTRRVYAAQEEERLRLSRELHDDLGAMLTPLKSRLFKLSAEEAPDPMRVRSEIEVAIGMIDGVIQQVRRLGRDLRPPSIDAVGLAPVMQEYCRTYAKHTGLEISFESPFPLPPLPGDVSIGLYRILQEALTNIVRHAQATRVSVTLRLEQDLLQLAIADDGHGFPEGVDPHSSQGIGLAGMRERLALLQGTFTVTSLPGRGVRLQASLPMSASIVA